MLIPRPALALTADEAKLRMKDHVVVQHEMWKERLGRTIPSRATPTSPLIVEYLTYENALRGLPAPKSAAFKRGFQRVYRNMLTRLPQDIKKILKDHLAGVVAVQGLHSSGQTVTVRDSKGKAVAAFIAIDVDRIKEKVNAWATARDGGLFEKGEYRLEVKLVAEAADRSSETMLYVLLHEIGHVLARFTHHIPAPDATPAADWSRFGFLNMSWIAPQYRSDKFGGFPSGMKLEFYKPAPVNANAKLPNVYEWLEKTNYPSLLAASDFHEDFAESFVHWARVKRLNRPYSLSVYKGDTLVKTYLSCFVGTRCNDKAAVFQALWKEQPKTGSKNKKERRQKLRSAKRAKSAEGATRPSPPGSQ